MVTVSNTLSTLAESYTAQSVKSSKLFKNSFRGQLLQGSTFQQFTERLAASTAGRFIGNTARAASTSVTARTGLL